MNILITSAGSRVSLVRSFQKEIRSFFSNSKVLTVDVNANYSGACHISDGFFNVERLDHPDYIKNLLHICKNNEINLIIPTIDTELQLLAENVEEFEEIGTSVVISDKEFIRHCRDKRLTHKLFLSCGIEVAKEYEKKKPIFPLFIKPYDGSSSVDTFIIKHKGMLTDDHLQNEKLMFLEYLDLDEYKEFTVDIFYDRQSKLKCIVPRERIEVRGGEVRKGITRKNEVFKTLKEKLSYLEGARGCLTTQVFQHKSTKRIIGIEINPRFGGGYPLTYLSGANYTRWIIEEYLLNKEIRYFDAWEDNLLMLRYDDEILVHDSQS
jgi:carbamoyl-phosphate synthase large subunit